MLVFFIHGVSAKKSTYAEDAHSSYFYDNLDGTITARIISYNLLGETNKLLERCVTPK